MACFALPTFESVLLYPHSKAWAKWQAALQHIFLNTDSRFLRQLLGAWTNEPCQDWQWFFDQYGEFLYEMRGEQCYAHPSFGRQLRGSICHDIKGRKVTKPPTLRQITVKIIDGYIIYSQTTQTGPESNKDSNILIQDNIWSDSLAWICDMMTHFPPPTSWEQIIQEIWNRQCIAVTDGSFNPLSRIATACWVIKGQTHQDFAKGAAHTPGYDGSMDPYRAELFGIYCVLLCVYKLCSVFDIRNRLITISCDCEGALTRALRYKHRPTFSHPNPLTSCEQFSNFGAIRQ